MGLVFGVRFGVAATLFGGFARFSFGMTFLGLVLGFGLRTGRFLGVSVWCGLVRYTFVAVWGGVGCLFGDLLFVA